MASKQNEVRSLMDEFLPNHDFSAAYEISINAPASVVSECLLHLDFNELWLVRLLLTLRTGKRPPRNRKASDLRQRLQGTGFVILADVPNEEVVIGVAGKFWRPDGGRCLDLTTNDFVGFDRAGYAKAAWNFRLRIESPKASEVGTESGGELPEESDKPNESLALCGLPDHTPCPLRLRLPSPCRSDEL